MKRGWRILRRVIAWAGVTAAVVLLLYLLLLPVLVHREVTSRLHELGFSDVSMRVESVGPHHFTVQALTIGSEGRLRVDSVRMAYELAGLRAGRFRSVIVSGVDWTVQVGPEGIDLGPLASLRMPEDKDAAATGLVLPFERLELRSSVIRLNLAGESYKLPVEGTLLAASGVPGVVEFDLRVDLPAMPVRARGTVTPDPGAPAGSKVELYVSALRRTLAIAGGIDPAAGRVELSGSAALGAEGGYSVDLSRASATAPAHLAASLRHPGFAAALGGRELSASGVRFDAQAQTEPVTRATRWKAELHADSLAFAGDVARNVVLQATQTGAQVAIALSGEDENRQWRLTGDLATTGGRESATQGDFAWRFHGPLPRVLVDAIAAHDVSLAALGPVTLHGQAVLEPQAPSAGGWRVRVSEAWLDLSGGAVALPNKGLQLHGVAGRLLVVGAVSRQGSVWTLARGSRLTVEKMIATHAAVQVTQTQAQAPLLTLEVEAPPAGQPALPEPAWPWRAAVPNLRLDVAQATVALPGPALQIEGLHGSLPLSFEAGPQRIQVDLTGAGRVAFARATWGSGDDAAAIGANELTVAAEPGQPLVSAGAGGVRAAAEVASVQALRLESGEAQVALAGFTAQAEYAEPPGAPASLLAYLQVSDGSANFGERLSAQQLAVRIPLALNVPGVHRGTLTIGSITAEGEPLPALTVPLEMSNNRLSGSLDWKLDDHARLRARGWIEPPVLQASPLAAHVEAQFSNAAGGSLEAPFARLARSLSGFALAGKVDASATVEVASGRLTPMMRLKLEDVVARDQERDLEFDGVGGELIIDGWDPLSSPGGQIFRSTGGRAGDLELDASEVQLQVQGGALLIERLRCTVREGGTFFLHALRLGPGVENIETELFIEDLPLQRWVPAITNDKVLAQGRAFGRLAVTIRPGERQLLSFGDGYLYARPGGVVQVTDTAMLAEYLRQDEPSLDNVGREVRRMAVAALTDFRYDQLRLDFHRRGEQLLIQIHTSGQGRQRVNPVPIGGLTVNVRGDIETLINGVIRSKLGIDERLERAVR